jgi:hypothetical protein
MSEEFNDYLTYNIGEKYWVLSVSKNWNSEKIKMVDSNGVEWYRYPEGQNNYRIDELEIVGKLYHRIEGVGSIWYEEGFVDRYCVRMNGEHLDEVYQEDLDNTRNYPYYFRSREEAEAKIAELKASE